MSLPIVRSDILNTPFSHIYIEKELKDDPRCSQICNHFPNARIILIDHYKDLFNRKNQDPVKQHRSQNLIIAQKSGKKIYAGAPVCQDFGNQHFYYTSTMMNCMYDCEYCYLKGMYPSGNCVIFLNIEDVFEECEELLKQHPVYLCVSYDSDLMAAEDLTGHVEQWIRFTAGKENLSIEIRTKCGRTDLYPKIQEIIDENSDDETLKKRIIFAYTLSPDTIVKNYEHKTSSLAGRLEAARRAKELGLTVRLCFDPMIYSKNYEQDYGEMLEYVASAIDLQSVKDFSVGSFRISDNYLKTMRKSQPTSAIVQFPYEETDGYYHYSDELREKLEGFVENKIKSLYAEAQIYRPEQ